MLSIAEYTDRFILLMDAVKAVDPVARSMGPVVSSYNMDLDHGLPRPAGRARRDRAPRPGSADASLRRLDLRTATGHDRPQTTRRTWARNGQTVRGTPGRRGAWTGPDRRHRANAAIWDTGCTRGPVHDRSGPVAGRRPRRSPRGADAANVWIHLQPGRGSPFASSTARRRRRGHPNYWPVALAAWSLSSSDPTAPVEVLPVDLDTGTALTAYAVRRADESGRDAGQ